LRYIALCIVSSVAFGQSNSLLPATVPDTLQVIGYLKQSELAKDAEASFRLAQKALALSEKLQYDAGVAHSYVQLGDAVLRKKDYGGRVLRKGKATPQAHQ
jgi:hypothetical protein